MPVQVCIEPGQFEQVLMNLVVNARDAMPDGGTVDITVEPLFLDERDRAALSGDVRPAVTRGSPSATPASASPPNVQPHVFEPFFTTKAPSKGTGLGLSIVYGIAKETGGTDRRSRRRRTKARRSR